MICSCTTPPPTEGAMPLPWVTVPCQIWYCGIRTQASQVPLTPFQSKEEMNLAWALWADWAPPPVAAGTGAAIRVEEGPM